MTKRKPVVMPPMPPYSVLLAMAGNPLILAASDEQYFGAIYEICRTALLLKAKRKGGK